MEGRIDHMVVDAEGRRLFVAALGNNSVEVIDLKAGKHVQSLKGFREPQGVGFEPRLNRLLVANGGDGSCDILDASTYHPVGRVKLAGDADNVRGEPATGRMYVGFGSGGIGVLDPKTAEDLATIPLPGHPESFQLEPGSDRIFVNVPDAAEIAVVDRIRHNVIAEWPCDRYQANFPMELDEAGHRLFIGCRKPSAVVVFDTRSGRRIDAVAVNDDADDLFYDPSLKRLYASCGAGTVDIFTDTPAGGLSRVARVPTAAGARTSLFVPALHRLFVAVPHRGSQGAEIRVYEDPALPGR